MNTQQIIRRSSFYLLALIGLTLFASPVAGQVFDSGPSDPALFSNVVSVPPNPDIGNSFNVGSATQLNVSDGGSVGDFLQSFGGEVNVSGGSVGGFFTADFGSEVNISGGSVGDLFMVFSTGISDSQVTISGGSIGDFFIVQSGTVTISGGTVGSSFTTSLSADVELIGGEFQLNGEAFSDPAIPFLELDDVFTGTLVDGSTFMFSGATDFFTELTLTPAVLPALDLSPIVVSTSNLNLPSGLRSGQTLTLVDGGELGINFEVINATLDVEGGVLGAGAGAVNSTVNISGGTVDGMFHAFSGSEVNISGGNLGDDFFVFPNSAINLFGSNFVLDGVPQDDNLTIGDAVAIADRDVTLSGLLADGSPFSFDLNSLQGFDEEFFSPDATLTLTLTSSILLGDVNQDGVVDFSDIGPFIAVLIAGEFQAEADIDENGVVNFEDIGPFIQILIGS